MNIEPRIRSSKLLRRVASLLACLIFACIAVPGRSPIPDDTKLISGDPVGLTDYSGKEIVPTKYSTVAYYGNGLFLMAGINPKDRYHAAKDKHIFNCKGEELAFTVPPESELLDIFWLGSKAEEDESLELSRLPSETLLLFENQEKKGLCDKDGNVLIPANGVYVIRKDKVNEDTAILMAPGRRKNNPKRVKGSLHQFFVLDFKSKAITALDLDANEVFPFSDGIATFRPVGLYDAVGFLNKSGKVVIRKNLSHAGFFVDGFCSVRVKSENPRKPSYSAIINRNYVVVSPKNMSVDQFFGEYAVAQLRNDEERDASPKFGLVNKKFEYVIRPEYRFITPVFEHTWRLENRYNQLSKLGKLPPKFYFAGRSVDEPCVALSPEGNLLFTFAPGVKEVPDFVHGTIRVRRTNPDKSNRFVYLDLKGNEIAPPITVPDAPDALFGEIAPGVLKKTDVRGSDRFDAQFWARHPGARLRTFGYFLKEYNMIGMPRTQLLSLLPHGESPTPGQLDKDAALTYSIKNGLGLKVFFRDDHVYKWCFLHGGECAPYFDNVVIENERSAEPVCKLKN